MNDEYEELHYSSRPYEFTAPANLAGLARLHGIDAPIIENARILELGCASGGNLIPHSMTHPGAELVGIDLSPSQIAVGQELVDTLECRNVTLHAMSVEHLPADLGQFDYVIAHGLYSWVPTHLQETILQVMKRHLSPKGIGFISMNTHPGWLQIQAIRDAMIFSSRTANEALRRSALARQMLSDLKEATQSMQTSYASLINEEWNLLDGKADSYVAHDHLGSQNHPVYVEEFLVRAEDCGLQFLTDSDARLVYSENFSGPLVARLQGLASVPEQQQVIDFFVNRRFRRTLLCNAGLELRPPDVSLDTGIYLYTQIAEHPPFDSQSLAPGQSLQFRTYEDQVVTLDDPIFKAMFYLFIRHSGSPISLPDLFQQLSELAKVQIEKPLRDRLLTTLLTLIKRGIVKVSSEPARYNRRKSEQPEASRLARHQSSDSDLVVNLRHQNVALPPFERFLLRHLDGSQTLSAVVEKMMNSSFSALPPGDPALAFKDKTVSELNTICANCLVQFRANALIH